MDTVKFVLVVLSLVAVGVISESDDDNINRVLTDPTRAQGCIADGTKWKDVMDCVQCTVDSCADKCKKKGQLPSWFSSCYNKTQWSSVADEFTVCLNDKTNNKKCVRLPAMATILKSFDRKQFDDPIYHNLQKHVSLKDLTCLGFCAFSGVSKCFRGCDRFNGTSYTEHPAAGCFESNKGSLNQTVTSFLTCVDKSFQ